MKFTIKKNVVKLEDGIWYNTDMPYIKAEVGIRDLPAMFTLFFLVVPWPV